jgi:flagellar FliL protein
MSDKEETTAEAPKKKSKLPLIIIIAVVLLGGGGAGAFFMLKSDKAAAVPAPVKGTVVVKLDSDLTINLADGHYLKLGFALQETADAGTQSVDPSEAINLAIDEYTGKTVAELSTEKGRDAVKEELLKQIVKAYTEDKVQKVMDIYYTAFVTQ